MEALDLEAAWDRKGEGGWPPDLQGREREGTLRERRETERATEGGEVWLREGEVRER
jgi:hypothetical protein